MEQQLTQSTKISVWHKLRWFSLGPITGLVLLLLATSATAATYQTEHQDLIFAGVAVAGVDVGGLTEAQAAEKLQSAVQIAAESDLVVLRDSATGQEWRFSPEELGLQLDARATAANAFSIGRTGDVQAQWQAQFAGWFYGLSAAPVVILDERHLLGVLDEIAAEIGQMPINASIQLEEDSVDFMASQVGRVLDKADAYNRLLPLLSQIQPVELELLVHESLPQVRDAAPAASQLRHMLSGPVHFYLQSPLDGVDLHSLTISEATLREWLRVQLVENEAGQAEYEIFYDEVALRQWLDGIAPQIAREPENARFYFDDPTRQLVVVEEHVNGRRLNIEATLAQFHAQVQTANRSIPLVVEEILPVVHSGITAEELGITELVSERTTWFYGSSSERKHNIARSAANFYGIVIAPGEEFSFNKYLGDISEEDGYKPALIIYGGQTIEGLGGGVCQVSTTLFQAVFWGGYDLGSRLPHAYRVGYYDDGEGPGMDATVFTPLVDFTFTNNTEHYLLIENYYNQEFESLTFKIYSTGIGRRVEKSTPVFENVQPALANRWEYDATLDPGTLKQVEWAAEGARVIVERTVYNFADELRDQDVLVSNYIPWGNVYQYGPGVNINSLPNNWRDLLDENQGEINLND